MQVVAEPRSDAPHDHLVHIYDTSHTLLEAVGKYLSETVQAGNTAVVVATPTHRAEMDARMAAAGIDLVAARARGALVAADAQDSLNRFFIDGQIDAGAFDRSIGGIVRAALQRGRPVRIYGEMVAVLWDQGHITAAVELESLWNRLGRRLPFSLYCAYPAHAVLADQHVEAFNAVCDLHAAVIGVPPDAAVAALDPAEVLDETVQWFDLTRRAPGAARRFTVDTLTRWKRHDRIADAALIVSELAANAVVHAGSAFSVTLTLLPDTVRVAVRDSTGAVPVPRGQRLLAQSGRGLVLVSALAKRWGTESLDAEKVVWADL